MAKNYKQLAMIALGLTIAELRDPIARERIAAKAYALAKEDVSPSGRQLRQRDIARALASFPGFADDPEQYGPGVAALVAAVNAERGEDEQVARGRVVQHVAKLRAEGIIDSASVVESTGKRGRPEVFYFLVNEETFSKVLSGEYVAKGEREDD
jgi:hypothetical protein